MKNAKTNKILGLVSICINSLIVLISLHTYCLYNFTNKLFLFRYPNWMLLINAVLGTLGIYISILLYQYTKEKTRFRIFLILLLLIWLPVFVGYVFPIIFYNSSSNL